MSSDLEPRLEVREDCFGLDLVPPLEEQPVFLRQETLLVVLGIEGDLGRDIGVIVGSPAASRRRSSPSVCSARHCSLRRCFCFLPPIRSARPWGTKVGVEGKPKAEPIFYGTYFAVTAVGGGSVLAPGAPLVPILFLTQAVNAILLLPLLLLMIVLARDRALMGDYAADRRQTAVIAGLIGIVALCTVALAVLAFQ